MSEAGLARAEREILELGEIVREILVLKLFIQILQEKVQT